MSEEKKFCSFCGKRSDYVETLVVHEKGCCICSECIEAASKGLERHRAANASKESQ